MKKEKKNEKKNKKGKSLLVLILLLGLITVGYSVLSQSLNINGSSKIKDSTWDISPGNDDGETPIRCPQGEICTINPENPENVDPDNGVPTAENPNPKGGVIWMDGDTVYFKHLLEKPTDTFTFDVDFKNTGSIDAKIAENGVEVTGFGTTAARFLDYSVYYKGTTTVPAAGDTLSAGETATFTVTVTYKSSVTTLPTAAELAEINGTDSKGAPTNFKVTYVQA